MNKKSQLYLGSMAVLNYLADTSWLNQTGITRQKRLHILKVIEHNLEASISGDTIKQLAVWKNKKASKLAF